MPSLLPIGQNIRPKLAKNDLVGYVIDNNDPEKRQRVKIRCAQLHRNVEDADLPWCIPDTTQGRANAGEGAGSVNVPVRFSKVYFRLDDNDPHNPRYSGSPTTDDVNKDNELLKDEENYPHSRGTIDDAGNRYNVNSEKETIDHTHKSGTTEHTSADGTKSISSAADMYLTAQGDIYITAKGSVFINGVEVHLNNGGEAGNVTERKRPQIEDKSNQTSY